MTPTVRDLAPSSSSGKHPSARWRSVGELLGSMAAASPRAPAASFPSGSFSYAELAESSLCSARRLRAAGVEPGDRVGILLREASEPYVSYGLGAMRLGAVCVPINARNKVRELDYVVRHSGMRVLLTSEEFRPLIEQTGTPEQCRVVVLGADAGFEAGAERVGEQEVVQIEQGVQRDTAALLLYTSGTTAEPKGCLHTHSTLLAEGENCAMRLQLSADDRFWTPLPMFHVGGWQVLLTTMTRGACFSHVGVFEPSTALDQLARERCTIAFPAFELIWMDVLKHPRFAEADLSALRAVINVGVPERMQQMQSILPHAIQVSCFGLTESCGSVCMGALDDSLHSRTHTSGRPLPGMEVRVVDPESGEELPTGVPGELLFRGVTQCAGYFAAPEATAQAIDAAGWFHTGDMVRSEEDGSIAYISRLKDMLKVGGENVSAADIEGYLLTHPAVAVVAVVGTPDARYGQVPVAFVKLHPGAQATEDELIEFCIGQIATYKVPRYVRFVDEFPATPTEKIKKFALRERISRELAELGIAEAPRIDSRGRRA